MAKMNIQLHRFFAATYRQICFITYSIVETENGTKNYFWHWEFFRKAMVIKSEALYNMCHFEHALVLFHRGQVIEPSRVL